MLLSNNMAEIKQVLEYNIKPVDQGFKNSDIVDNDGLKPEDNATNRQIFAQNAAPSANYKEGDLFFDTSDGNTIYRADSTLAWVNVQDGSIFSGAWDDITGAGKPDDNATVGAIAGTNFTGAGTDNLNIDDDGIAHLLRQTIFGNGADGALVTSGDVTLTADTYYTNLTISAGDILYTAGYRLFVSGTLTIVATGYIKGNGNAGENGTNAASSTPGTGGAGGTQTSGSLENTAGVAGGSGSLNNGTAGTAGTSETDCIGGDGKAGGAGGDTPVRTGGAGGAAGTATAATGALKNATEAMTMRNFIPGSANQINSSAGSGGGGGGAGDSGATECGGGGGGSGATGVPILISAKNFINNQAGGIQSHGGVGGSGGNGYASINYAGGGGGGAGGNGGVVVLIYETKTGAGTVTTSGGDGGAGGSGVTVSDPGQDGASGTGGDAGATIELNI